MDEDTEKVEETEVEETEQEDTATDGIAEPCTDGAEDCDIATSADNVRLDAIESAIGSLTESVTELVGQMGSIHDLQNALVRNGVSISDGEVAEPADEDGYVDLSNFNLSI